MHAPIARPAPVRALPLLFQVIVVIGCICGCTIRSSTPPAEQDTGTAPVPAWRIDHAVIVVDNLSAAGERYADAGFIVVCGGKHGDGTTQNSLIPFEDGSYLELFAASDPATADSMKALAGSGTFDAAMAGVNAMDARFMHHLGEGPGLRDFAISYPEINLSEIRLSREQQGIELDGPIPMSRTRPDGIVVRWQVIVPVSPDSRALPFLIRDDTPRNFRVPGGNTTAHPNHATGIEQIIIATPDQVNVTRWYDTVLSGTQNSVNDTATTYRLDGSAIIVQGADQTGHLGQVEVVLATVDEKTIVLNGLM